MPQVLLTDSISVERGAQEPWPEDVKVFQPLELEQILLSDCASSLSVKTFLKMCQLPYQTEYRSNAEHMSPSGRVPFIKAGAFVVAELDPIVAFVANKNISLTRDLDNSQKADMRAYMALVNNVLLNAEMYISWLDNSTYDKVTAPRYGSVYPWPLNNVLTRQKKNAVSKKLKILGWKHKSLDEVYGEVEHCCTALSERLEGQNYFFGNLPTELDALVFGHLFTLLTTPLPDKRFAQIVKNHKNLVDLCKRIDSTFFVSPSDQTPYGGSRSVSSSNGNDDFDKLDDINQISE